jgi:uncharacterized protein (DUF885 family)
MTGLISLLRRWLPAALVVVMLFGCASPPPAAVAPEATLDELTAGLDGLDASEFIEEAYRRWVLRFPQTVTTVGLGGIYEVGNGELDCFDSDSILLTQSFEAALLAQAATYDLDPLPEDTRFDLRVFISLFESRVALHPYQWFEFPLFDWTGSLTDQYVYLLMAQQPFRDEADVADYLARLEAIGPQIDQMIEYLQARQAQGIQIPYPVYAEVMAEMGAHDWEVGWKTPFITVLAVRLQNLDELSHAEREIYYERGGQIADDVILPAFERLTEALYTMAGEASERLGLSTQPGGAEAYQAMLDHATTLDIPVDDLFSFAEARVAVLGQAVRGAAEDAGYDSSLPLQEIFRQAKVDRDYALGLDIFVTLRSLMLDAEMEMDSAFETMIGNDLVMVPVFEGGFYEPAALDGSRKAAFYGGFSGQEAHFDLPTRVYHETFPGRHYLASVIRDSDLPLFRKAIRYPVFDEGWSLYAEHLAWEMGLYADDPNANLGRLQRELIAAARVVVDIGIHARGWDAQKAARYLVTVTGMDRAAANEMVLLQIAQPAEAVAAYVGMDFILEMRDKAQSRLGEAFDLKAFHTAVLSNGSLPLPLLEEQVWNALSLES